MSMCMFVCVGLLFIHSRDMVSSVGCELSSRLISYRGFGYTVEQGKTLSIVAKGLACV